MKIFLDEKVHTLHPGFTQHISGIPADADWDVRGLTAHELNRDKRSSLDFRDIQSFNEFATHKEELMTVLSRVFEIYKEFKAGKSILQVLDKDNKDVHLILGFMRTGGTYLFKQVMEAVGLDYRNFAQKMTHDSIPTYHYCLQESMKDTELELALEMAEYTYWLEQVWPSDTPIVQKRIAYSHAPETIEHIFGGNAHFWISMRDPTDSIQSFFKMDEIDNENPGFYPGIWQIACHRFKEEELTDWHQKPNYEKGLDFWALYHIDMFKGIANYAEDRYTIVSFENPESSMKEAPLTLNWTDFANKKNDRADYFNADLQNQAIDRVLAEVDSKFHPYLSAYKV